MSWRSAAALAVLFVVAAAAAGLAGGRLLRPPAPTPVRVSVTTTEAPAPTPSPIDEATLFRQPFSGGCATEAGVWVVTNGGGLLRFDGTSWTQVDGTLRSLVSASCSQTAAYAAGLLGAVVVGDEQGHRIQSTDLTTRDLYGVVATPDGAMLVGASGTVFLIDHGDVQPFAKGIDEDLFGVVAFGTASAWAVGDGGITYRLDQRGWNAVRSGQTNALRAVAAKTAANPVAVGDAGTIVMWNGGAWRQARSGVDVALRAVIVEPAVWVAGDAGTLLVGDALPSATFRRVDLGTGCDLVALFARRDELWVVGRGAAGGGVWLLRPDGSLVRRWGRC